MTIFLIIIGLILAVILVFALIEFINIVFRNFAPFFLTNKKVINLILKNIAIKDTGTVYELGSGLAWFLRAVEKKYKRATLIGVEYSPFTYLLANLVLQKNHSKIKMLHKDLFNVNLKEADLIYCFLLPEMLDKLADKLQNECRLGTVVVSYLFSIPNLELRKTIDNNGDIIYFYEV